MANGKFTVTVPDVNYWRSQIKCQAACPVQTDARGYVTAVARGEFETGYQIAHDPNPLSTICGRICGAPCEAACRRAALSPQAEAVAIRPLKRVVTERHGPEAGIRLPGRVSAAAFVPLETVAQNAAAVFSANPGKTARGTRPGTGPISQFSAVRWSREELRKLAAQPGRRRSQVAVIGAGPSGLTVAHDLALLGHHVTIFEAGSKLGGMIRYGVPAFRFDQEAFDLEIQQILDMGVEVKLNTPIGKKIKLADLRRQFDAVYLGLGLMKGRLLNIEGVTLDGVITAVDLLLNYNSGYKVELGRRVLVVGGGDVAMDAARTALRLGQLTAEQQSALRDVPARTSEESETVRTALDVARTALRLGVSDVRMIALESWDELPASKFEVEEALEEGIQIFPRRGPHRIVGVEGKVAGVEVIDVAAVFDSQGRFAPTFKPNSARVWECDTVILAIGQQADLDVLGGGNDINLTPRGFVAINPDTGQTSAADVFAGGDIAYGPHLLIDAVKHGHLAALGMEQYLQNRRLRIYTQPEWTELPNHVMFDNWCKLERRPVPTVPIDRRTGVSVVELGYSEAEAAEQGARCLECSVNTIFDGSKCILCNGCVDVCPWNCLKIVSLSQIDGDAALRRAVETHLGAPLANWQAESAPTAAAMLKDDDACTRCALCAERCPTGAISMEAFRFQEALTYA